MFTINIHLKSYYAVANFIICTISNCSKYCKKTYNLSTFCTYLFFCDFHRYFKLCHFIPTTQPLWLVGTSGKKTKSLLWGIWLKPMQWVFDLDPDASGEPSTYSPIAVHQSYLFHLKKKFLKITTNNFLLNQLFVLQSGTITYFFLT